MCHPTMLSRSNRKPRVLKPCTNAFFGQGPGILSSLPISASNHREQSVSLLYCGRCGPSKGIMRLEVAFGMSVPLSCCHCSCSGVLQEQRVLMYHSLCNPKASINVSIRDIGPESGLVSGLVTRAFLVPNLHQPIWLCIATP